MFAVAWNVWRNRSRKRSTRSEILHDEMPDMVGPSPNARKTLLRLAMRPDVARVLLDAVNVPPAIRYENVPKSSYGYHLTNAREVDTGRWREPKQSMTTRKHWTHRRKG